MQMETDRLILRELTMGDFDEFEDPVNTITKVYAINREEWNQNK